MTTERTVNPSSGEMGTVRQEGSGVGDFVAPIVCESITSGRKHPLCRMLSTGSDVLAREWLLNRKTGTAARARVK